VTEAFNWQHGTFMGATASSEQTAAATGAVGVLRRDPMAMLPFCGYHMGDYFNHWLKIGKREGAKLPKIFYVNWFRKSPEGKFLWPGFGENSRVLEWAFNRINGNAAAVKTPVGYIPAPGALNTAGLNVSVRDLETLLSVDREEWTREVESIREHFKKFGSKLPKALSDELAGLEERLKMAVLA